MHATNLISNLIYPLQNYFTEIAHSMLLVHQVYGSCAVTSELSKSYIVPNVLVMVVS